MSVTGKGKVLKVFPWVVLLSLFAFFVSGCGESEEQKRFHQELIEKALNDDIKKEGEAFLADNRSRSGVVVTESGLQYEVLQQGSGERPTILDSVRVNYTGWRIGGEQFDSSAEFSEKPVFPVKGVIKGWRQALLQMQPGARWKVYLPSELGYGATSPNPKIPANSALMFEIELLEILPQQGTE